MAYRYSLFFLLIAVTSCRQSQTILPDNYREQIETDFLERSVIPGRTADSLKSVFKRAGDSRTVGCLKFLYAYMPLNDLADYPASFFMANTVVALKARDEMPWGNDIPEDVFLHYLLPVRVNNENLDSFRILYYDELKDRIAGLALKDAALEINRWCHEKVTYQPSDIRTSSPMATILSARGRCGEESTFTVAALRTVGIPARQVYTPRWAHTDDNHAWVEIWADGEWYYMGACEPEPVLDRGWFTEPAARAMLVHTKAFGYYGGNELIVRKEKRYAEINNLSKYAATKPVVVRVNDEKGLPLANATVEFCLYNYAEFFPIASVKTDNSGYCTFVTGLGNLLVWTDVGGRSGFSFVAVAGTDTLILVPALQPEGDIVTEADLNVPGKPEPKPGISPELADINRQLIAKGDSIRNLYIDSWIKTSAAGLFAAENGYNPDRVVPLIMKSQGNYREIMSFLSENKRQGEMACDLLSQLSEKDLRDTRSYILTAHLKAAQKYSDAYRNTSGEVFEKYVLNPRIANEMLTDWRDLLLSVVMAGAGEPVSETGASAVSVLESVNRLVTLHDEENYYGTPVTPSGVALTGLADTWSARIFVVACLRAAGIPARLEPGTDIPQYFENGNWVDAVTSFIEARTDERASITFTHAKPGNEPRYYVHFTLAKYSSGRYNTLTFDYDRKVSEFPARLQVVPGKYLVVTGNRLSDNMILARLSFFGIEEGSHRVHDVTPRTGLLQEAETGTATAHLTQRIWKDGLKTSFVAVWMNPETEPAKHFLKDLPSQRELFDNWPGKFVFFSPDRAALDKLNSVRNIMPASAIIESDEALKLLEHVAGTDISSDPHSLPYIILVAPDGKILFRSSGYRIGTVSQLAAIIR